MLMPFLKRGRLLDKVNLTEISTRFLTACKTARRSRSSALSTARHSCLRGLALPSVEKRHGRLLNFFFAKTLCLRGTPNCRRAPGSPFWGLGAPLPSKASV
jgi:hypothetical protein